MKISDVLRNKGTEVITIRPDDTVSRLLEMLDEHGIGALVVSTDGSAVDGIVSERARRRLSHISSCQPSPGGASGMSAKSQPPAMAAASAR